MIRLFLLSERQMARISPYFPLSHGVRRVDDRRVISGILYVIPKSMAPTKRFTTPVHPLEPDGCV